MQVGKASKWEASFDCNEELDAGIAYVIEFSVLCSVMGKSFFMDHYEDRNHFAFFD